MKPKVNFALLPIALAAALAMTPVVFAQQSAAGGASQDMPANTVTSPDNAPAPVPPAAADAPADNANNPAMDSFKDSMHDAAQDTEQGVKHAYHATRTALTDTAVTAKAKAALAENKRTAAAAHLIHVDTVHGVVTLSGDVASPMTARRATAVVARLTGVKRVVCALTTSATPGAEAGGSATD